MDFKKECGITYIKAIPQGFICYLSFTGQQYTEIIKVISDGLTGTSGVLGLIFYLVASILGLVLFALTLLDSKPEANKYGDSPKYVAENVAEE